MAVTGLAFAWICRPVCAPPSGHPHHSGAMDQRDELEEARTHLPARLAWFPRSRFVDREGATGQGRAIEGVNGRLRCAVVRHLDEAKAPGAAGLAGRS